MHLAKNGTIILDLDDVVKTNCISCQAKRLSIILFGSLLPIGLHKNGLPNLVTQEGFFPIRIFDKLVVNITLYSKVEEEIEEEDGRQENSLGETTRPWLL